MISNTQLRLAKVKKTSPSKRSRIWFLKKKPFKKGSLKKLSSFLNFSKSGRNHSGRLTVRSKKNCPLKYQSSFFIKPEIINQSNKVLYKKIDFGYDKLTFREYSTLSTNSGFLFKLNSGFENNFSKIPNLDFFIQKKDGVIFDKGQNFKLGSKGSLASSFKNKFSFVKSSGTFFIVVSKDAHNLIVKMPSGKLKKFPIGNFFKIGQNLFPQKKQINYGSFGLKFRIKGGKSKVRGVAKNPVDHPHGGGEGKKSGIKKSPQGWYNALRK